ncbi:MAG: radical SAM protein [Candidatus Paceibacterota bacterium]
MKNLKIITTSDCNNKCIFCIFRKIRKKRNKLTIPSAKLVMGQCKKKGFDRIFFTGGEPTLYPALEELIKYAHELKYGYILVGSNGLNFKNIEYCKKLIKYGKCEFAISIHSLDYMVNNYLVQNNEHFSSAIQGLLNLKKLEASITVRILVTRMNFKELLDLSLFLNKNKVKKIQFQFYCMAETRDKQERNLVVRVSEIEPYIEAAMTFCIKNNQEFNLLNFPFCFLKKYNRYNCDNLEFEEVSSFDGEEFCDCKEQIKNLKVKNKKCEDCPHNYICGGVWKYYIDLFGWDEFCQ